MESENKVNAILILDVIGRPAKHLTETLKNLIDEMQKEKGVSVKSKKINEPRELKEDKNFYTSFAEIEVEVNDLLYLALLMFKYMPAHVEIISPEIIAMSNNGFNEIFNELIRRLHGYDEVARIAQIETQKLREKFMELEGKNKTEKKK